MQKKFLIFSSAAVTLFILGSFFISRNKIAPRVNIVPDVLSSTSQNEEELEITDSKGGVDVSVTKIIKENNQTILSLAINNHVTDYSKVDLKEKSELAGAKPVKYTVDTAASGGHHVSSQLIFSGNLSGLLTIKLTDDLIFNLNIK